jgi:hypothetical protein
MTKEYAYYLSVVARFCAHKPCARHGRPRMIRWLQRTRETNATCLSVTQLLIVFTTDFKVTWISPGFTTASTVDVCLVWLGPLGLRVVLPAVTVFLQ